MMYSLDRITTAAMCDTLLEVAGKDRDSLDLKRKNLSASVSTFDTRTADISTELITVQARLETYTDLYEILPEGKDKINANVEIKRMEARKALLDKQVVGYNVFSLLDRQIDHNYLDSQIAVLDAYITAVTTRKTALGGA